MNRDIIIKVFKDLSINVSIEDFITAYNKEEKIILNAEKAAKEEQERIKTTWWNFKEDEVDAEDETELENKILLCLNNGDYKWNFHDYDVGMDDDGDDSEEYISVGDRIFYVSIHCEANWVGDWSVKRKNLPGDLSIKYISEVDDFDIISKDEHSTTFKLI